MSIIKSSTSLDILSSLLDKSKSSTIFFLELSFNWLYIVEESAFSHSKPLNVTFIDPSKNNSGKLYLGILAYMQIEFYSWNIKERVNIYFCRELIDKVVPVVITQVELSNRSI